MMGVTTATRNRCPGALAAGASHSGRGSVFRDATARGALADARSSRGLPLGHCDDASTAAGSCCGNCGVACVGRGAFGKVIGTAM